MDFPHVRTVIKVRRQSSQAKTSQAEGETRYYISPLSPEHYTHKQWLALIRGHWGGIEIRNHWRKDACLFEDKTRSRNPTIVGTLAMLRNLALFFLYEQSVHSTITGFVEANAADQRRVFSMIKAKS
jgi:predicted transposase YbfD/YdcC